jgi:hypothetical protein
MLLGAIKSVTCALVELTGDGIYTSTQDLVTKYTALAIEQSITNSQGAIGDVLHSVLLEVGPKIINCMITQRDQTIEHSK